MRQTQTKLLSKARWRLNHRGGRLATVSTRGNVTWTLRMQWYQVSPGKRWPPLRLCEPDLLGQLEDQGWMALAVLSVVL